MSLFRRSALVFILKLFFIHLVCGKIISFKDGEVFYEYDNNSILGDGVSGIVYKGIRIDGNTTEDVAFKVILTKEPHTEISAYESIGSNDHIPKYYGSFQVLNQTVMVIELLRTNLFDFFNERYYFSTVTVMRIGLQMLDVLEHIHKNGVVHKDLHMGNLGLNYKNTSIIYLFDFGESDVYSEDERENIGRRDLFKLAYLLRGMACGYGTHIHCDCKETIQNFIEKVEFSDSTKSDYERLRNILRAELEKHKDEPNYETLDWQKNKIKI